MTPSRIIWIENKSAGDGLLGPVRIGRVTSSKSGSTLYYNGRSFRSLRGQGYKANYVDTETGEEYWISGCRRDGMDALYNTNVQIDNDVREEYWLTIRNQSENVHVAAFRAKGKY
jgi:hypothetical protein